MGKDLQEESNMKLQIAFKKVLELIDNGEFYVTKIEENVGGISLSQLTADDLATRNKVTFNFNIDLTKMPGKENPDSNTGNLVNSTVVKEGKKNYYDSAVNHIITDLIESESLNVVLNNFIKSKINTVIDDMTQKKGDVDSKYINQLKEELLKEMVISKADPNVSQHLALMIEKNMADPILLSKLQASINYDQFKKSVINNNQLEFSHCINSYLGGRIDIIMQQKKELLISEIKKNNLNIKSEKIDEYIKSKIIEQNEKLKSTLNVKINGANTDDVDKLKKDMNENIDDDEQLNNLLNNFLIEQVKEALVKNEDELKKEEAKGGNKEEIEVNKEVMKYMEKLIETNIKGSNFKDVENMVLLKSNVISS